MSATSSNTPHLTVLDEVHAERVRAHLKHGDTSMESFPSDSPHRYFVLLEEVGEVAKEFNEARHDGVPVNIGRLRAELIQVAAMATAWADACGQITYPGEADEGRSCFAQFGAGRCIKVGPHETHMTEAGEQWTFTNA